MLKNRSLSLFAMALSSVLLLNGCWKKKETTAMQMVQKPHVTVERASYKSYMEKFNFPGRVEAVSTVTLKARVAGFLKDRLFEEGDIVKKGQLLFTLEREPFEAKVAEASANLTKAEADAKNARLKLDRALELRKTGNVSQATLDAREAENSIAKGQVLQAQAALNLAKLDLSYTSIKAPFTGKIGLADYSLGEYLPVNTTLATIVSFDPIYVLFSVSERELLSMQNTGVLKPGNDDLAISLLMADSSVYRYDGRINFTDVVVDDSTDTVKMRAVFPNPSKQLVSGQFVSVLLEYNAPVEKIVIPQTAIMSSVASKYVYVVDAQNKIINKPIRVGVEQGKDIVVLEGLEAGERVVVDGLQKVRPGQEVVIDSPATVRTQPVKTAVQPTEKTATDKKVPEKTKK
ncbi:MAG: efflux RND transporter periplasmic adaptor subunit [Alphaproteobacteria bacterium]|nr:efflux RND transporter periplasmic adaptor subunit [Alphaproteobacteria bacterium]MBO4643453.1 efflux RND transporter periplasmic adaptor subunit [Alphaproteobacteria bacterium]